jgi:aspartyl-tRNA(Asn)/glutamyl-tRNA(Gln) amidotransferase subunit B
MQEGSMRADVNLSVRPRGQKEFGTRTEMKNIASLKAIERAIEYERDRQIDLIEEGGKVVQETRRWDDEQEYTYSMRSKENAQDYKYFPDPDLMPINISDEFLAKVKSELPEFADAKRERYVSELGLPEYDAEIITGTPALVRVFEAACEVTSKPKDCSNWLMTDLLKIAKDAKVLAADIDFDGKIMGKIINLVNENKINRKSGQKALEEAFLNGTDPDKYIADNGLAMVSDTSAIEPVIKEIIASNEKAVSGYLAGEEKNLTFLIGQSMRALKGKADHQVVRQTLIDLLNGMK